MKDLLFVIPRPMQWLMPWCTFISNVVLSNFNWYFLEIQKKTKEIKIKVFFNQNEPTANSLRQTKYWSLWKWLWKLLATEFIFIWLQNRYKLIKLFSLFDLLDHLSQCIMYSPRRGSLHFPSYTQKRIIWWFFFFVCLKLFLAHRSISEGGKRSVFLTNTQALARQQAEVIGKMTALNVRVYTGDMDVDNWNKEKWTNEFETGQV